MHLQLSMPGTLPGRTTDLYGIDRAAAHRLITALGAGEEETAVRVRLEPETVEEEAPWVPEDPRFPTVYAMSGIGVQEAQEAQEAFHFCSVACQTRWLENTPAFTDGGYHTGQETLSVDGEVCEECGEALEGQS